jgi:hypothetical protein
MRGSPGFPMSDCLAKLLESASPVAFARLVVAIGESTILAIACTNDFKNSSVVSC